MLEPFLAGLLKIEQFPKSCVAVTDGESRETPLARLAVEQPDNKVLPLLRMRPPRTRRLEARVRAVRFYPHVFRSGTKFGPKRHRDGHPSLSLSRTLALLCEALS
jgi:hypothetical protein